MEAPVLNVNGDQVDTVNLPDAIFGIEDINVGLMHQAYVRQTANARQGNHKVKNRTEVRGSTAKIYRQKGTGRARHGARTAPIFVGGGQAFGPKPRKYTKAMPRKMRQQAIRNALSALMKDDQLVFVDDFALSEPKTREAAAVLQNLTGGTNALLLLTSEEKGSPAYRSVRNIADAAVLNVNYLNIRDLLTHDKVVVPLAALDVITSIWGKEA